jgi:hypothetical protein
VTGTRANHELHHADIILPRTMRIRFRRDPIVDGWNRRS